MGAIWDLIILNPILNVMIVLANTFAGSFGLAIIAVTVIVRLAMIPLTLRQIRSTRAMQEIQPKIAELQKKYGKDRQKLSEETMKLYKEHGISPLGCIWPMLIQLPIWIALFTSIRQALAASPHDLLELSRHLYSWSVVNQAVPLDHNFLWLNLAQPDPYYILPILVGVTMWVQQRMTSTPNPDPAQKNSNMMMQIMMPLLFAFITLSFPSGLGVYFVVSAIVGIIIQYFVVGWGGLLPSRARPAPTQKQSRKVIEERVIDSKVAEYMSDDDEEESAGEEEDSSYWGDKKKKEQPQLKKKKARKDGRIRSRRKNR